MNLSIRLERNSLVSMRSDLSQPTLLLKMTWLIGTSLTQNNFLTSSIKDKCLKIRSQKVEEFASSTQRANTHILSMVSLTEQVQQNPLASVF